MKIRMMHPNGGGCRTIDETRELSKLITESILCDNYETGIVENNKDHIEDLTKHFERLIEKLCEKGVLNGTDVLDITGEREGGLNGSGKLWKGEVIHGK